MEGAAKNLQAEVPENDFDKYLAETKANWNRQLGKIEVESNNQDDKVNFYTALYHSMIAPTIYSDVDGAYYGPDKKVHQSELQHFLPLGYLPCRPSPFYIYRTGTC
jgi:putative alpha-1,2-mannosidase